MRERRLLEWPPSDPISWSGRNCLEEAHTSKSLCCSCRADLWSASCYLHRLAQNRSDAEEICPALLQPGEFFEPFGGFFLGHALSAHDKRFDRPGDPIAEASRIVGCVED